MTKLSRQDEIMLQLAARASDKLRRNPKLAKQLNMRPNTKAELDAERKKLEGKEPE